MAVAFLRNSVIQIAGTRLYYRFLAGQLMFFPMYQAVESVVVGEMALSIPRTLKRSGHGKLVAIEGKVMIEHAVNSEQIGKKPGGRFTHDISVMGSNDLQQLVHVYSFGNEPHISGPAYHFVSPDEARACCISTAI
jgi:hypothetical protein